MASLARTFVVVVDNRYPPWRVAVATAGWIRDQEEVTSSRSGRNVALVFPGETLALFAIVESDETLTKSVSHAVRFILYAYRCLHDKTCHLRSNYATDGYNKWMCEIVGVRSACELALNVGYLRANSL